MDQSVNQPGMNSAHTQQRHNGTSYQAFMDDVQSYAAPTEPLGTEDFNFPWDAALFANAESYETSFPQQSQQPPQHHPAFNQTLSRQANNSPALPQFQPSQHSQSPYSHSGFSHNILESRNPSQPNFDPRFISGSSASPAPFEDYQYHPAQINYNTQHYSHVPQYQQPRQVPAAHQYSAAQRPAQSNSQYMNIAPARPPSQLARMPNTEGMFHSFQATPNPSHTFINPGMLSNNMNNINGPPSNSIQQSQQLQPQYFAKPSPVDPQVLQQVKLANISPAPMTSTQVEQSTASDQIKHHPMINPPFAGQPMVTPEETNGVKKPKAKATKQKSTSLHGNVDSADELEIEDEPPEMKPALLTVNQPTDVKSRALYDAVQAVWSPRNKPAPSEKVRSGLAAFGETVRNLRDAWKEKNEALKKAELPNSDTAANAQRLKGDVAHFRQIMESVMSRSLQYGHESIVRRLAENHFTLSALYSFMLDRANAGDYDSSLVTSIFQFAVKFETLDEEKLESVKWSKILQRFTKKAGNQSKDLAKQILLNASAETARKRLAKSEEGLGSPASTNGSKLAIAGAKRARDGDVVGPAPKKIVKPASKPLALQHAERRKALEKEATLKQGVKTEKSETKPTVARPKVTMVAPHKNNAFASLLSASKKPGTSNAEKKAAAVAPKDNPKSSVSVASNSVVDLVKKDEGPKVSPPLRVAVPSTAAKSSSAFMSFLTDIDKPKETETKKSEEVSNETDEQRAKRLRKESRRRLRVSWKPDSELVQTRLFTHDPEEETGHADSMMRDAGDTAKEGEMLKLHKGIDDIEDDDQNEDTADEADEYSLPSEVDFSVIDLERTDNFIKLGGPKTPESSASQAQAKYEENTVMVTYTFRSDRPDTPKELPSVNEDDDFSPSIDFGEPEDKIRRREKDINARRQQPQVQPTSKMDLATQLRALTQQSQQPQPAPPTPNLQHVLGLFNQQTSQSVPAPTPAPAPATGPVDMARLHAVMQQLSQLNQPQSQQQQVAPQYAAPPITSTPSAPNANLAALVAQFTAGGQASSLPMGSAGNPNPFPGAGNEFNRKHDRSDDFDGQGGSKKKKQRAPVGPDGKPLNYKTQVCSFYKEGKCIKGDNCTYKHDE